MRFHHIMSIMGLLVNRRQGGTRDPLLQRLHLDKRLLEQQNTKMLERIKKKCVHGQLGQIMKKIQKGQDPSVPSEVPGAKGGSCA